MGNRARIYGLNTIGLRRRGFSNDLMMRLKHTFRYLLQSKLNTTGALQQIEAERDGPCREINFDPTVLPPGIQVSDDPFPAARSAAYMKSYDLRTAEAKDYPRTETGTKP